MRSSSSGATRLRNVWSVKRWYHLSFSEAATLILALASFVLAYFAYRQSQDNRDTREAIKRMAYLGQQTFRQANTAQNQLGELRLQTAEMGRQTGALTTTAESTTSLAGATVDQLRQRDRQFALEQQPDVRWDPELADASRGSYFSDDRQRGLVLWNFGYKNYGKSAAYDLVLTEGISLFGQLFVERKRTGNRFFGPGETGWSTAIHPIGTEKLPVPVNAMPVLRVIFTYKDALGSRYTRMICHRLEPPQGIIKDCNREPVAKLPRREM